MLRLLLLLLSAGAALSLDIYKKVDFVPSEEQAEAAKDVVVRLLGKEKGNLFEIRVDPTLFVDRKDVFQILKTDNDYMVTVTGSSGVAAAWGFHYYLKQFCKSHISWSGDQITLPDLLPNTNVTIVASDKFRYYQNVCTDSYSYVWWGWTRWQREIDWMALNGINLALAPTAQESVWKNVYANLGMTQQEIDQHFSGPAFFAWNRMGNMRGFLGPLSESWHQRSVKLQIKIIRRMRELGIIPVVPAFSGIVPRAFPRLYPATNFTKMSKWNNFPDAYCCPYLIPPTDSLFQKIGSLFLQTYKSIFGTYHVYNCDTFNEMLPQSGDLEYLRTVGKSVYESMTAVDADAIWLLQGWLFYNAEYFWTSSRTEALLTSVPLGKMLILDLQSESYPQFKRLNSYFGQPFIWCMLHNFGGTSGMHGVSDSVNQGPYETRNDPNTTMVGIGLTPEGIFTNYVIYDLMLETGWRKNPVNLTTWFIDYSSRRYGSFNSHAAKAWQLLLKSVYCYTSPQAEHGRYILTALPTLSLTSSTSYNEEDVYEAWKSFLLASDEISSKTFTYDLVDLTRQSLQLLMDSSYFNLIVSFETKDIKLVKLYSAQIVELLNDLDKILGSHEGFLLGSWISAARSQGSSLEEKELFEENARNQITLWGPDGEIHDYAAKQWGGLMKDYYLPRWSIFLEKIAESLITAQPFNQSLVNLLIFNEVELPFTKSNKTYPVEPTGDPVDISKAIYDKWMSN